MWITIISDASWCPVTGICGYGYYIGSSRILQGGLSGYGVMKERCETAQMAEAKAVVNALSVGVKDKLIEKWDKILIRIDCEPVINLFQKCLMKTKEPQDTKIAAPIIKFLEIVEQCQLEISFRHVKGHQVGMLNNAELSNQICDLQAKYAMRLARDELSKTNTIRNVTAKLYKGDKSSVKAIAAIKNSRSKKWQ